MIISARARAIFFLSFLGRKSGPAARQWLAGFGSPLAAGINWPAGQTVALVAPVAWRQGAGR